MITFEYDEGMATLATEDVITFQYGQDEATQTSDTEATGASQDQATQTCQSERGPRPVAVVFPQQRIVEGTEFDVGLPLPNALGPPALGRGSGRGRGPGRGAALLNAIQAGWQDPIGPGVTTRRRPHRCLHLIHHRHSTSLLPPLLLIHTR